MKRREFFEKSGCGLLGLMMAEFGFASGQKEEAQDPKKKMSREDMVKKMLMEKMGKTEEEADTMIIEMKEKLPMVKDMCICKTCPTFVAEETEIGFCHPLVGKSKIITEEKGCDCPKCPVYQKMSLKNGYYCTRKSEMEQEMVKKG
jgi:hypothetical protein